MASIKYAEGARPIVDQLLARAATSADKTKLNAVLKQAAGIDGNKVLTAAEAQLIASKFSAAQPGDAKFSPETIGKGLADSTASVTSMRALSDLDGVSSVFTFQDGSVKDRMISELKASVARANGRPMEINMLIFEFQSDTLEKALLEIAKENPNVTIRLIADSGQATDSGGNALPSLLKESCRTCR